MDTSKFIIFLDIDGVIATNVSYRENKDKLDRKCISVLNHLTESLSAKIIISSTWRILFNFQELKNILKSAGVKAEIISKTPRIRFSGGARGEEILHWIEENKYIGNYLVIDDDINDIISYISEDKIIHVEKGFSNGGLLYQHISTYLK